METWVIFDRKTDYRSLAALLIRRSSELSGAELPHDPAPWRAERN
jgi:hypothetical protein